MRRAFRRARVSRCCRRHRSWTAAGTTPTKPRRPVPVQNVRACSKSPPKRIRIKRLKSPSGDTPGRELEAVAGLRQNAADLWMRRLKGGL
jgi:hypothetical protein